MEGKTYMESNPEGAKVELVWQGIHILQSLIETLYGVRNEEGVVTKYSDSAMEEIYHNLNDMALDLSNRNVMDFQQEG